MMMSAQNNTLATLGHLVAVATWPLVIHTHGMTERNTQKVVA